MKIIENENNVLLAHETFVKIVKEKIEKQKLLTQEEKINRLEIEDTKLIIEKHVNEVKKIIKDAKEIYHVIYNQLKESAATLDTCNKMYHQLIQEENENKINTMFIDMILEIERRCEPAVLKKEIT